MTLSKKPSSATRVRATRASASHDSRAQHSARRSSLGDTQMVRSDGLISKLSTAKNCHSVHLKKRIATIWVNHLLTPASADVAVPTD